MDEIDGRSSVYVDTNIFIYFIEATPGMFERVVALLNHANRVGARLVTCELTVAECLYKPHRDGDAELIAGYEKLFASGGVEITPLDGGLARRAARHGGELGLKLIDAIHYIAALEAGCDVFVTGDARFRSGPYMRVVGV